MSRTSTRGRSIPPETVASTPDLDAWASDIADAYDALPTDAVDAGRYDAEHFRALGLPDEPPF